MIVSDCYCWRNDRAVKDGEMTRHDVGVVRSFCDVNSDVYSTPCDCAADDAVRPRGELRLCKHCLLYTSDAADE